MVTLSYNYQHNNFFNESKCTETIMAVAIVIVAVVMVINYDDGGAAYYYDELYDEMHIIINT